MEHTSTFLGVAPGDVFCEFINREFLLAFSSQVGVESGDLAMSAEGGVETAAMPWSFPTDRDGIPSLARKLLPSEVHLDWGQRWGPSEQPPIPGAISVALHGTPSATVTAEAQLRAHDKGTEYRVITRTKTSLRWPVAGTVEGMIDKELVGWILQVQSRVLRQRLDLPDS